MTVATTPGGDLQPWNAEDFGDLGMEDIGAGELTIPRMEIVHDQAMFRDRNSKAEFPKLRAILLGVVKGRIFWAKEVDDNDQPLCRSNDFTAGFPQMRTDIPEDKQFPWAKSNFNPADNPPGPDGLVRLPCDSCRFKEWDNNGFGQKKPPCSELYMLPLLYQSDADGTMTPAILTLKSSAVKNVRNYITPFKSARRPMFTVYTELSLQLSSRGSVKYSVPSLKQLEATAQPTWGDLADQYRSIREFLQRDPRPQEKKAAAKPTANSAGATALDPNDPWNQPPAGQSQPDWPAATPAAAPPTAPPPAAPPGMAPPAAPPRPATPASDLPF